MPSGLTKDNGRTGNCSDVTCSQTYAHPGPHRSYTAVTGEQPLVEEIRYLREQLALSQSGQQRRLGTGW